MLQIQKIEKISHIMCPKICWSLVERVKKYECLSFSTKTQEIMCDENKICQLEGK